MQEASSLLAREISALNNPLTLEYVSYGEPLIISIMQFFHWPNSLSGNVIGSGAKGHGFKSSTELPTTHHRCDFSSKGALLPKCIVAASVDLFTKHVIPVTTRQVRDSIIV